MGTRPQRQALVAVATTSLLFLPIFFAFQLTANVIGADGQTVDLLAWVNVGARMLFPLGFLVALVQAEFFAGAAHARLLRELGTKPSREHWRDAVADALHDPGLKLGYRDSASGEFRDARAVPLPPAARDGRWSAPVERDGDQVARLDVDEALREDPELVRAAAHATALALEQGQLQGELRASRARLVEAADIERRRLQRDLHDSAQQRLVALRVQLGLAAEMVDEQPGGRAMMQRLADQLEAALDELRGFTHGLYPAVLERHGVAEALRSACRRAALPVHIVDEGLQRQAAAVESAIYFCCLEAVQNAAKHAGRAATVSITLASRGGDVTFVVQDDGSGFDIARVERGIGLSNMADRIAAVGGRLRLDSAPTDGTRVLGSIPARAPERPPARTPGSLDAA
jgi:signal transduction histidine kinase